MAYTQGYRTRRAMLPTTLCFTDMTQISASTLEAALGHDRILAKFPDIPTPELLIERKPGWPTPITVQFANRRQAQLFVAASNAWRDPSIHTTTGELHWSLLQAARLPAMEPTKVSMSYTKTCSPLVNSILT